MISFEDFQKVEMKIGKIKTAERVPNSDKLVKLEVDVGSEMRQLVAGIAHMYEPEQLVGKEIVVVMNLEPRKLRGVLSQGMLLAADAESGPIILVPDKPSQPGTIVR